MESDRVHGEEADARRRRLNDGALRIYGLLAAQVFRKTGHARVMGMELQQAKADATKLQAEL